MNLVLQVRDVTLRRGAREVLSGVTFDVEYDDLVVALGSITDFRAVPGMSEYALGVRLPGDRTKRSRMSRTR